MERSKDAPIYSLYGVIYATFGLGVRHTGRPGRPEASASLWGALRSGMPIRLGGPIQAIKKERLLVSKE